MAIKGNPANTYEPMSLLEIEKPIRTPRKMF